MHEHTIGRVLLGGRGVEDLAASLLALILVDERVGHDAEEPRLAVRVLLERVPEPVRAEQGILDQVLASRGLRVSRYAAP